MHFEKCRLFSEEIVAGKLSAAGVSWGYCSAVTRDGWRWIVDAHSDDGRHRIVYSDELLSAFIELEATLKLQANICQISRDTGSQFWRTRPLTILDRAGRSFAPGEFLTRSKAAVNR